MEYDYDLQVWFDPKTRIIEGCKHPVNMKVFFECCNADRFAGQTVEAAMADVMADRESISSLPVVEFEFQVEVSSRFPYRHRLEIYRAIKDGHWRQATILIQYLAEISSGTALFEDPLELSA